MQVEDRKLLIKMLEEDGTIMVDKGNYYVGRCPFHPDKTASFFVYKNNYKFVCFGCGAKGDILDYICKARDIPFSQAVKYLNIEHKRSKFIKKRLSMLQIISNEEKDGINVEKKYGKNFIDGLLARELVGRANDEGSDK
jgi:DNA primase